MSLDLCKGIAVIIDDKAQPAKGEDEDQINRIIKKISGNGIPYCVYTKLSDARKVLPNLSAVNFLILDWDMQGDLDHEDADEVIKPSHSHTVIKFIKDFRKVCFCPIFIFSNANVKDIESALIESEIFSADKQNFIHIQAKKDLIKGQKLFKVIDNWINQNPTLYTLKNWENNFQGAKNETFWHLFSKSPVWPKIMWESFTEDSVDPQSSLNDVIYKLIKSRTSLTKLDPKKVNRRKFPIDHEEIKDVIQGMMFIDKKNVPENEVRPGDIFKKQGNYFINIRPECDTVIERIGYDGKVYLLKGSKISAAQFKKNHYAKKYGIVPSHTSFLLYGLDGRDFIRFNLKEMLVAEFSEYKESRICRLISPYINDIQQQYSAYVGRFGLPRIPNRVLKGIK